LPIFDWRLGKIDNRKSAISNCFPRHSSLDFNMVVPHLPAMLVFSFLVSVVFGLLSKDTPRDRLLYGAEVFVAFVGVALVLGWIMYPLP
jgi:hypothetical protein